MFKKIWDNRLLRFLILAFGIYLTWYVVYEVWIHPWGKLDLLVINNLIAISSVVLVGLGYDLIPPAPDGDLMRTIGIDGTHGLWVGDPCNGLTLFALFIVFVAVFPGPRKSKLWFIPLGILLLHLLNMLRIVALSIIVKESPEYLNFNHIYVFTTLLYLSIFILWYIWIQSFSGVVARSNKTGE